MKRRLINLAFAFATNPLPPSVPSCILVPSPLPTAMFQHNNIYIIYQLFSHAGKTKVCQSFLCQSFYLFKKFLWAMWNVHRLRLQSYPLQHRTGAGSPDKGEVCSLRWRLKAISLNVFNTVLTGGNKTATRPENKWLQRLLFFRLNRTH